MFSLVKVRYWRALMIWQNHVGSENKQSSTTVTLEVEIGVSTGLNDVILAWVSMSRIYLSYHRIDPY